MNFLAFVTGLMTAKRVWDKQVLDAIQLTDLNLPLAVSVISQQCKSDFCREEFTFHDRLGEQIPVLAMLPEGAERHPAIVFLYGSGMRMKVAEALAESVTRSGFALFVPEQFGRGTRRQFGLNPWQKIIALRHRILRTITESRQLAYLVCNRADIDPRRIYLWGASFGAMTGCAVMAYDQHFQAAVFTLGGGNLQKLVADTPFRKNIPRLSWLKVAAPLAATLLKPFDPIWHVGHIAPRPILFQNTRKDEIIPLSSMDALHQAASSPKQIMWYDSMHDLKSTAAIEILAHDALTWLQQHDREIVRTRSKVDERRCRKEFNFNTYPGHERRAECLWPSL